MKNKILILLAIFFALGAFVYFYEIQGAKKREKAESLEKSLLKLENDDVESVSIIQPGKDTLTYIRKDTTSPDNGSQYKITSPVFTDADELVVSSQLSTLLEAKIERSIRLPRENLKHYGLDPAKAEWVIRAGKKGTRRLMIGNESSERGSLYATISSGLPADEGSLSQDSVTVVLSSSAIQTQIEKTLFDLRDKKIAHFDPEKVRELALTWEKEKIVLEKLNDNWEMVSPRKDIPLDQSRVSSYLENLRNSQVKEFVSEQFSNEQKVGPAKKYGFNYPSVSVKLSLRDEKLVKEIVIGKKGGEDNDYYVYESGRPQVFLVKESVKNDLAKPTFHFVDKKIARFKEEELTELHFSGAYQITLTKEDSLNWRSFGDSTFKVAKSDISRLLTTIKELTARDIAIYEPENLATYGLERPFLELEIRKNNSKVGHIYIGDVIEKNRYVKSGNYPFVFFVPITQIESVTRWLSERMSSKKSI